MEKRIFESGELPEYTKLYLRRDFLGWRVVHPVRNENGTMNWMNFMFGGKRNLVVLIILALIFGILYVGVSELINNYKDIAANPCRFCVDCHIKDTINYLEVNLSNGLEP
jgi:hypothetical protein